jgi:hypothetical protein
MGWKYPSKKIVGRLHVLQKDFQSLALLHLLPTVLNWCLSASIEYPVIRYFWNLLTRFERERWN